MKQITALLILLSSIPCAFASTWKYIDSYTMFHGRLNIKMYIDTSTIKTNGPYVETWIKEVQSELTGTPKNHEPHVRGSKNFVRINCIERLRSVLFSSAFDDYNATTETYRNSIINRPIEPDSINEEVFNFVCQKWQSAKHREHGNFKAI